MKPVTSAQILYKPEAAISLSIVSRCLGYVAISRRRIQRKMDAFYRDLLCSLTRRKANVIPVNERREIPVKGSFTDKIYLRHTRRDTTEERNQMLGRSP